MEAQIVLTKLQKKTFKFVKAYIAKNKKGPTFKEVSEHLGGVGSEMQSVSHLKALQTKGILTWESHKAHSIRIVKDIDETPIIKPLVKTKGPTKSLSNGPATITRANGVNYMNGHANGHSKTNGVHVKEKTEQLSKETQTVAEIMANGGGGRSKDDILQALARREAYLQERLAEIQIARKVINTLPDSAKETELGHN